MGNSTFHLHSIGTQDDLIVLNILSFLDIAPSQGIQLMGWLGNLFTFDPDWFSPLFVDSIPVCVYLISANVQWKHNMC